MAEEKKEKEAKIEPEDSKVKAEEKEQANDKAEKKEVDPKFKDLVETIEKMSVLELSELVKVLEDRFGVVAAAPVAAMPSAAASADDGDGADEQKSSYTIELTSSGDKKIEVIKAVREITGLGLAESKALVDSAPKTVKENVVKEEADEAKKKLEEAGATVELK